MCPIVHECYRHGAVECTETTAKFHTNTNCLPLSPVCVWGEGDLNWNEPTRRVTADVTATGLTLKYKATFSSIIDHYGVFFNAFYFFDGLAAPVVESLKIATSPQLHRNNKCNKDMFSPGIRGRGGWLPAGATDMSLAGKKYILPSN